MPKESYPRFREQPACGTRAGYDFHVRQLEENPCADCREANARYFRNARIEGKRKNKPNRFQRDPKKVPWTLVLDVYGNICYLCKGEIDLLAPRGVGQPGWEMSFHPDHVVPLSKGGADVLDNIRPTHGICNQKKANKVGEIK